MEAEAVAVCAALYTGLVWGAGALSTWIAVEPMRRRLDALENWLSKFCEQGRQSAEATDQWAGRVATWCFNAEKVLAAHDDALNGHREQMQIAREEVEELKAAVQTLRGAPLNGGGLFGGGQDAWALTACSRNLAASVKAAKLGAKKERKA